MKIVADENIPYVRDIFSEFGEVVARPGRSLSPDTLVDADVLLVRSVTPVNASLLDDSPVKFVGTATSGLDHIDQGYLQSRNIAFSDAIGANARSVAEYVVATILSQLDQDQSTSNLTCGIVGFGNVGKILHAMLRGIGVQCLIVDPFVSHDDESANFRSINELTNCDVITFHVPLTSDGSHPTYHMINRRFLKSLRPDTLLINTSRGAVADTDALLNASQHRYVIDVWEGEPDVNRALLDQAIITTPHIAGYSWDGKVKATRLLFDALNRFCATTHSFPDLAETPSPLVATLEANEIKSQTQALRDATCSAYPIMDDDAALRAGPKNGGTWSDHFDSLRKSYWPRREFGSIKINREEWPDKLYHQLVALGFGAHF